MGSLLFLNASTSAILLAVSFVSALLQTNHACATYEYRVRGRHGAIKAAYEVAIAVYLVLGVLFIHACYAGIDGFYLRIWRWNVPLVPLLYLDLLGAAIAAFVSIYLRKPLLVGDAIAFLCLFPPVMEVVVPAVPLFLYVAWFFARALYVTRWDIYGRNLRLGRHLASEALKNLPEGVMLAQANGRVLLVNDAMRRLLSSLDRPLRLSDANEFWSALSDVSELASDGELRVRNHLGRTILFYRLEAKDDHKAYVQYWAYDVTESIELAREIGRANDQLASAADRMEGQLDNVGEIAQREALLAMQARMHDVASQRLSILHGMLQMGRTDDVSLAEVKPLLVSIVDDLASEESVLADSEGFGFGRAALAEDAFGIQPLQHAFSLIGTRIELVGDLPEDDVLCTAFAQVIREAATNAVRHAHAKKVVVTLGYSGFDGCVRMSITNDGKPASSFREGNGIRGMRRRIERLAGTMDVVNLAPFTLCIEVPSRGASAIGRFGERTSDIGSKGEVLTR